MAKSSRGSPFLRQCFVTAAVCCNIIGNGATNGFSAVLLPQLREPGSVMTLTKEEESWIASIMAISIVAGNFIATSIMGSRGRLAAHYAVSVVGVIGGFATVVATNFMVLFIGRILLGLSFGISLPLRSVLIGEYTSPKNRGAFLMTVALAQGFGIFFVHLIGTFISWQMTALICVFFPFVSFVMTIYCPESPSYLASKGKYDECRKAFRWLRGDGEEKELEELIEARMVFDEEKKVNNLKEIFLTVRKKEFYKPIILMVHAHAMLQFSGGSTMAAYSTIIIALILGDKADASFWMIFLDVQRLVFNVMAIFVINKFRRRTLLFSTGMLCVLCHVAISLFVYAKNGGIISKDATWIGIILINIQFFTVATGTVPLPNVITGEIFPLEYRSIGSTISVLSGSLTLFTVLKTFPGLVDLIAIQGTYLLYAGIMTYFFIVMWFLLPETRGRTLQEIEDEFTGRPLKPEELEVKQSLNEEEYLRKMSVISTTQSMISFG